jgi:glutamyl-tRNA synthetase
MTELDNDRPVRVRIAPSPTGNCHVGTARNALYNLLFARQRGGAFVLRIDDTDVQRSTLVSERGVLEGLQWLGLQWDEGPDMGGPFGPYRQSERTELYWEAVRKLLDKGRAYYCFCTPAELAAEREAARRAGIPYCYGGTCRHLSASSVRQRQQAGQAGAVRFKIAPGPMVYGDLVLGPVEQDAALIGDPIIQRANGLPTYSFATVVNEHAMQISHVLRGTEHVNNTFPQLQMYEALGVQAPAFGHVGLLLNPDRSKISKRTGAVYVGEFRDMGYLPEAMLNHLALSGWNPGTEQEVFSFDELLETFSLHRCTRSNAIFDRTKLLWLNGSYIRRLSVEELTRRIVPHLVAASVLPAETLSAVGFARLVEIVALEQERFKTLAEAPEYLRFFFQDPDPGACVELLRSNRFARRHSLTALRTALEKAQLALRAVTVRCWLPPHLERVLDAQNAQLGWKRAELLMPVRIAVSGREATPPLFETLVCLGRQTTLGRLETVVARLS